MASASCRRVEDWKRKGRVLAFMTTMSDDVSSLVCVAFTHEPLSRLCI
jgi:hypothetical protein